MTKHTTTAWDKKKKEYIVVPDSAQEKYLAICEGRILFDLTYNAESILVRSHWWELGPNGLETLNGVNVYTHEDLEELIATLTEIKNNALASTS